MNRIMKALCLILLVASIFTVSVSAAANFSFFFNGSGVNCSAAVKKGNDREIAEVLVSSAGNYTYKYAVGLQAYGRYITNWTNKAGMGGLTIPYSSQPHRSLYLYLHGATVSNSGTSTVKGAWVP